MNNEKTFVKIIDVKDLKPTDKIVSYGFVNGESVAIDWDIKDLFQMNGINRWTQSYKNPDMKKAVVCERIKLDGVKVGVRVTE
mgnify:CR=1 FL=1